jgi:hypothetical protein
MFVRRSERPGALRRRRLSDGLYGKPGAAVLEIGLNDRGAL